MAPPSGAAPPVGGGTSGVMDLGWRCAISTFLTLAEKLDVLADELLDARGPGLSRQSESSILHPKEP
jgi:hypothetical protein